ncbi:hypothetical protein CAL7102_08551 [Dulcicalothrix desertica PCC 7102]|nr:hypothetical protein CAL7102_08551 [Dulcicalothrix desertica PCC 7102]
MLLQEILTLSKAIHPYNISNRIILKHLFSIQIATLYKETGFLAINTITPHTLHGYHTYGVKHSILF